MYMNGQHKQTNEYSANMTVSIELDILISNIRLRTGSGVVSNCRNVDCTVCWSMMSAKSC